MRVCCSFAVSFVAWFAAVAPAQPVFFDDFDGDDLLPHWNRPPDSHWEYNVSGGMLHVTDLLYPSDDHFGGNYADMVAGYEPQADFRADVWMGWEAGDAPHKLALHVNGPQGQIIASFGYEDSWRGQIIYAASGASDFHFEMAPPPGMYHFTIRRDEGEFAFYFNAAPFASFTDQFGTLAAKVHLEFLGPYPGEFGAVYIDRVRVIPTPGVLVLLAGMTLCCPFRRRARRTRQALCTDLVPKEA